MSVGVAGAGAGAGGPGKACCSEYWKRPESSSAGSCCDEPFLLRKNDGTLLIVVNVA
jgi:hypothetical protein